MKAMGCSTCGMVWQVELVAPGGWRLHESPEPWAYGWLISGETPCCPFDGGGLVEATPQPSNEEQAAMPAAAPAALHELDALIKTGKAHQM